MLKTCPVDLGNADPERLCPADAFTMMLLPLVFSPPLHVEAAER